MTRPVYLEPDSIVLAAGIYEELNSLLQPTGTEVSLSVGERLPRSHRHFVWRLKPEYSRRAVRRLDQIA